MTTNPLLAMLIDAITRLIRQRYGGMADAVVCIIGAINQDGHDGQHTWVSQPGGAKGSHLQGRLCRERDMQFAPGHLHDHRASAVMLHRVLSHLIALDLGSVVRTVALLEPAMGSPPIPHTFEDSCVHTGGNKFAQHQQMFVDHGGVMTREISQSKIVPSPSMDFPPNPFNGGYLVVGLNEPKATRLHLFFDLVQLLVRPIIERAIDNARDDSLLVDPALLKLLKVLGQDLTITSLVPLTPQRHPVNKVTLHHACVQCSPTHMNVVLWITQQMPRSNVFPAKLTTQSRHPEFGSLGGLQQVVTKDVPAGVVSSSLGGLQQGGAVFERRSRSTV